MREQQQLQLLNILMKVFAILMGLAIVLGIIAILPGCNKDSADKAICRITTITAATTDGYHLTYNNDGKISTITNGAHEVVFGYSGNTIIETISDSGRFSCKLIITKNAAGLATNVRTELDLTGTNWYNDSYEYNGQELSKSTQTSSDGSPASIKTYTWTNNNIRSAIASTGTTFYSYYTDKPIQVGDYLYIYQLLVQGYETIRNRNLVKSINGVGFSYEFDSDGNISGLNSISGTTVSALDYKYECN